MKSLRYSCILLLLLQTCITSVHAQAVVLPYGVLKTAYLNDGNSAFITYLKVPFTNKADLEKTIRAELRAIAPTTPDPGNLSIVVYPSFNAALSLDSFIDLESRWLARIDTTDHMPAFITYNTHRLAFLSNDTTGDAAAVKEANALKRAHPEAFSFDISSVKLETAKLNAFFAPYHKDVCDVSRDIKRIDSRKNIQSDDRNTAEIDYKIKEYQKQYGVSDDMLYKIRMLSIFACDY